MEKTKTEPLRRICSGNGTDKAYTVQARMSNDEVRTIGGNTVTGKWRDVHFQKGTPGVPSPRRLNCSPLITDYLSYEAAQALRWWFISEAELSGPFGMLGSLCLETRIMQHSIRYSYQMDIMNEHPIHEVKGTGERDIPKPEIHAPEEKE